MNYYLQRHRLWLILVGAVAVIAALVTGLLRIREKAGQFETPVLALLLLFLIVSLGHRIYRSKLEYDRANKSPRPIDSAEFEQAMRSVAFPRSMLDSGYTIVEGGRARDLFNKRECAGFSATSPQLNRRLRERSAEDKPPFRIVVPPRARLFGSSRLGAALAGRIASVVGWRWPLARLWPLPSLAREVSLPVVRALRSTSGSRLANEDKIRLSEDLLLPLDQTKVLKAERTDYLSDLVTGHLTGVRIQDEWGHDFYNGYSSAFDLREGKLLLKTSDASGCSNQIGVSGMTLGISHRLKGDGSTELQGHLFFVGQAKTSVASPGLLAPSGSGSLDWSDFVDYGDSLIESGMQREMFEETWCGSWAALADRGHRSMVITGYGRMLHRGGKPEFYGLIVMPRDGEEGGGKIDPSETGYTSHYYALPVFPVTASRLVEVTEEYLVSNRASVSHPLYMCLQLMIEFLQQEPAHFQKMVSLAAEAKGHGRTSGG